MFTLFSKEKLNYNSGQVFPFLIAVICVVLVFLMITVNLGQLGIFKTDVSNAADAAALAAVSVLSATLLGLGATSDGLSGRAVEALIVIIILACYGGLYGVILAILVGIVFYIECIVTLFTATDKGRLGWTNAKKAALQYGFNNIGVDEPRPTFNKFLERGYNILDPDSLSSAEKAAYYTEYTEMKTARARQFARTGFSKFMEDDKGSQGYWKGLEIDPGSSSPASIVSGYGWGTFDHTEYNSYDYGGDYTTYDNWVEVKVIGSSSYPLELYSWAGELFDCLMSWVTDNMEVSWFLSWMADIITWMITTFITWIFSHLMFSGLQFTSSEVQAVNNNPILIFVKRNKRDKDLGLWNFRYGDIKAQAKAHAFQEHPETGDNDNYETIKPVTGIMAFGCNYDIGWKSGTRHLFETELQEVY